MEKSKLAPLHKMSRIGEGALTEKHKYNPVYLKPSRPKKLLQNFDTKNVIDAKWTHPQTPIPFYRLTKLVNRVSELEQFIGDKPDNWRKPTYGNLDYTIAHRMGWISNEDEIFDRQNYEQRRGRSLTYCHTSNPGRYGKFKGWTYDFETETAQVERTAPIRTGAYVPEMNAAVLRDHDLTDGAKICLAKLLEETYRNNRDRRWLATTVPYLMQALNRSRRTIQNYLRLLEHCGYIFCDVLLSHKTRMSNGLKIQLNETAFAKHHKKAWPLKNWHTPIIEEHLNSVFAGKSEAQKDSPNYFTQIYIKENHHTMSVTEWAARSMLCIYKRYMQNTEPYEPPRIEI